MIPEAAVEAAAEALSFETSSEYPPEAWRDIARAALEAAAPHMTCPKTHGHPDAQYVCMAKAGHDGND